MRFKNKLLLIIGALTMSSSPFAEVKETQPEKIDYFNQRLAYEEASAENPFAITTHKMNYILPYTYIDSVNREPYQFDHDSSIGDGFVNHEAKFQISLKIPIVDDIFHEDDAIYGAFTMKSVWQIYSADTSRPFRNSDYNPELFYVTKLSTINDRSNYLSFGYEHESNGQVQYLSRSWDRLYLQFLADCDDYAFSFKIWQRLPEDDKEYEFDPKGDDNPDIEDYYGFSEARFVYHKGNKNYSFLGRHNFETGKGYFEVGMTYPLYKNLKGYIQFTNGYGETLIDYNHFQRRIGLGIVFSDLL